MMIQVFCTINLFGGRIYERPSCIAIQRMLLANGYAIIYVPWDSPWRWPNNGEDMCNMGRRMRPRFSLVSVC